MYVLKIHCALQVALYIMILYALRNLEGQLGMDRMDGRTLSVG